ncbi:hypothetical protein CRE_24298 [Caenorhabditis remanei]|uniref:Uncharacterized protein n=1 Tax=Caenorhabditis remanei TaxID=31234 RepID=E3NMN1_CAERE|nr:hypothetical protein CRE_24298 [Caenorhabditis remanei]
MSVFLGYLGFIDFYHNTNTKLDDLKCSELQKIVFYSAIKTILFSLYYFNQNRVSWMISNETMLTYGMCGYGLITAWLPMLKAYQFVSLFLMCLQTLFLVIGALHTIKMALLYRNIPLVFLIWEWKFCMINFIPLYMSRIIDFFKPETKETLLEYIKETFIPPPSSPVDLNPVLSITCVITAAIVFLKSVQWGFEELRWDQ